MRGIYAICKTVIRTLMQEDKRETDKCHHSEILLTEAKPPKFVMDSIKMLQTENEWVWKGEFFQFLEEPSDKWEILMYTESGSFIHVTISKHGKISCIFPKNLCKSPTLNFLKQAADA